MQQDELNELMKASAKDAAATALEEFEVELDNTVESVGLVDDMLLAFVDKYHDKALEDETVFTLCNIFGAYAGEIFKATVGGNWRYDESDPDAPHILLDYGNNNYAFAGICYERLVNDANVSLRGYLRKAIANHRQ